MYFQPKNGPVSCNPITAQQHSNILINKDEKQIFKD
jgi:hypothetical protein